MRKNSSTIDIMDHHYQHHHFWPLAFSDFTVLIYFLDVDIFGILFEGDFRDSLSILNNCFHGKKQIYKHTHHKYKYMQA
jgi:hypothetical protein